MRRAAMHARARAAPLLAVLALACATTRPGGPLRTFPTAEHARLAQENRAKAADARNLSGYYGALAAEHRGQAQSGDAASRARATETVARYETMARQYEEAAVRYDAEALRQEAAGKTVGAGGGPAPREDADF